MLDGEGRGGRSGARRGRRCNDAVTHSSPACSHAAERPPVLRLVHRGQRRRVQRLLQVLLAGESLPAFQPALVPLQSARYRRRTLASEAAALEASAAPAQRALPPPTPVPAGSPLRLHPAHLVLCARQHTVADRRRSHVRRLLRLRLLRLCLPLPRLCTQIRPAPSTPRCTAPCAAGPRRCRPAFYPLTACNHFLPTWMHAAPECAGSGSQTSAQAPPLVAGAAAWTARVPAPVLAPVRAPAPAPPLTATRHWG